MTSHVRISVKESALQSLTKKLHSARVGLVSQPLPAAVLGKFSCVPLPAEQGGKRNKILNRKSNKIANSKRVRGSRIRNGYPRRGIILAILNDKYLYPLLWLLCVLFGPLGETSVVYLKGADSFVEDFKTYKAILLTTPESRTKETLAGSRVGPSNLNFYYFSCKCGFRFLLTSSAK